MRIVLRIKMHNTFGQENVVHRERLSDALSLSPALHSKLIVHFNKGQALAHGDVGFADIIGQGNTAKVSYWQRLLNPILTAGLPLSTQLRESMPTCEPRW